jgi:hypothetical protein
LNGQIVIANSAASVPEAGTWLDMNSLFAKKTPNSRAKKPLFAQKSYLFATPRNGLFGHAFSRASRRA